MLLIVGYGPVESAVSTSWDKREQGNIISDTTTRRTQSQWEYKTKTELLQNIETNKEKIITCINDQVQCTELPSNITEHLEDIKTYLQLGNLKKEKMNINEAKILKSINEFMLRANPLSNDRTNNGIVTNISIGELEWLENNIVKAPIDLTVTFNNKENLIKFISNIENNIFYNSTNGLNDSVLYRIEEMKYDIVNYQETQDVAITLSAYGYND